MPVEGWKLFVDWIQRKVTDKLGGVTKIELCLKVEEFSQGNLM
jgi:hypothetical protein